MQINNKKKICIVASSLGKGGAERSGAILSKLLHEAEFEVHLVIVLNIIDYSFGGVLLNLGEFKEKNNTVFGRINRFLIFKKYLKKHDFDFIIDSRSRPNFLKEFLLSKIIYNSFKTIYVIRSYKLNLYLGSFKFLSNLIYKNSFRLITVSKEIQERIEKEYGFFNVTTIYNPVDVNNCLLMSGEKLKNNYNYVLFYGRLDDKIKNISLLLNAYKISQLSENNIKLVILGEGKDKESLKKLTFGLGLNNDVIFKTFTSTPNKIISNALYTLLTSNYEGFPRVLIESLSLGVPVISVDCASGPKEIIKNGYNGLLVENNNPKAFAEAMNSFIFDNKLYNICKNNAKKSVMHLSIQNIAKQWLKLLE